MIFIQAFLLWSAIIPFAIANGALRDAVLAPRIGAFAARLGSGVILSAVIFAWTFLTIGWLGNQPTGVYGVVGLGWLGLTVTFEFSFGRRVLKRSWSELLKPYRGTGGDLWPIVLLVVAISPLLAAVLRAAG